MAGKFTLLYWNRSGLLSEAYRCNGMQAKSRESGLFNHFVLRVERFLRNPRFIGIIPPVPILFIGDTYFLNHLLIGINKMCRIFLLLCTECTIIYTRRKVFINHTP